MDYTEINNSIHAEYYTIDEVAKILKVEDYNIIYWCNKLGDFLKIQSIGMYQIFNEGDIKNLKLIKELNIDKKLSIAEVKEYIIKHNEAIIVKKENNPLELSLLNVMSKIITMQNNKIEKLIASQNKILQTNQQIIENQADFKEVFMQYHQELCIDREKQNSELQQIKDNQEREFLNQEEQQKIINEIKSNINTQLNDLKSSILTQQEQQEQQAKQRDNEILNSLRQHMEERKKEYEEAKKQENKSFWQRLFGK